VGMDRFGRKGAPGVEVGEDVKMEVGAMPIQLAPQFQKYKR
jgi:hypothetical protein